MQVETKAEVIPKPIVNGKTTIDFLASNKFPYAVVFMDIVIFNLLVLKWSDRTSLDN